MSHRSQRVRALALAAVTAAALAVTPVAGLGGSAAANRDVFAPQLVTVDTPTAAHKKRLQSLGLDLTEHAGHDYIEVVLHNRADMQRLEAAGLHYNVRIADLAARTAEVFKINKAFAASVATSKLPSGRTNYRVLADYNTEMAALATAKPTIARTFNLKRPSLEGRTIKGIEIGGNVKAVGDGRPTFLLMGVHHAREWPSGELAMEFATDLVKSYGKDRRITNLLNKARVLVVPVVNVDGFDLSRTDGEVIDLRELNDQDPLGGTTSVLATPGNAYKRKNCRIFDGQDLPDGACKLGVTSPGGYLIGTDLNRNYGGFWGGPGASATQADPTYRGSGPFSEPETLNIRDLVSTRQVTMLISNHTFSNLILRPNGVNPETIGHDGHPVGNAPDETALKNLGAKMASSNGYANIHGWELYDTTGTTEDWSYNATGGFGYTFEIGPNEFHPPFPQVVDEYVGAGSYAGKGNREAYLTALEAAVNPATHSLLRGKAPRGAVLRLKKSFDSPTWSSSFKDSLSDSLVSRGGLFTWHVNPSTRPVVAPKVVETTANQVTRSQTFQGGQTQPNQTVDHEFKLTETSASALKVNLDWQTPDDFDLEVYRKAADGTLVKVSTSGNPPAEKEEVVIEAPAAGTYVLRVINFAAVSPSYTLKADVLKKVVTDRQVIGGKIERYTITCEKNGKVLQTLSVRVDRGKSTTLDLRTCTKKFNKKR